MYVLVVRTRPLLPRVAAVFALSLFIFLMIVWGAQAADAGTADPVPPRTLWLPTDQLWAWVASALTMLPTYLFNHYGPQTSETVKGLVVMVTTAIAAGITQAITAGGVGFNQTTLQFVVTGIVTAFLAHKFIWQTTGIAQKLGAGANKQSQPAPA